MSKTAARQLSPISSKLQPNANSAEDSEADSDYNEIDLTEFLSADNDEETLNDIKKHLETKSVSQGAQNMINQSNEQVKGFWQKLPELPEDYVRNFMYHRGLMKALDAFQEEWYEFKLMGKLKPEDSIPVNNVYKQNEKMSEMLNGMREEVAKNLQEVGEIKRNFEQLTRERDYHRMHHKRLQHEKDKLHEDSKKMQKEMEQFEPLLKKSQQKFDSVVKEKSLIALERDKIAAKLKLLEAQKESFQETAKSVESSLNDLKAPAPLSKQSSLSSVKAPGSAKRVNPFPEKERTNIFDKEPFTSVYADFDVYPFQIKQSFVLHCHPGAVTGFSVSSKEPTMLATTSTDKTWRLWNNGELKFTGEGHKNIVNSCDFHPSGNYISTCSGDNTIKIWDTNSGALVNTLKEHIQPVWSCRYHDLGGVILSASMDHTIKLWDVERGKSRQTIRHHSDSVKQASWKPFSNVFLTCSADKKVTAWDARSGVCLHTFSQNSSINNVVASRQGDIFATVNSTGQVVIYDLRKMQVLKEITVYNRKFANQKSSIHNKVSLNSIDFHLKPDLVAVGGTDGFIRLINWSGKESIVTVPWVPPGLSPEEAVIVEDTGMSVNSVAYNPFTNDFISGGSGSFKY